MISKQVMAFMAGIVVVVAGTAAFVMYDSQNGDEIVADADSPSGDRKFSDDPSSGFISQDGQRYYLHYNNAAMFSNSYSTFNTNYTISFNSNTPGLLTGYVDNVQVYIHDRDIDTALFVKGDNQIVLNTRMVDEANSGLALVKQMQFKFQPLVEKSDIQFTLTAQQYGDAILTYTGDIPNGEKIVVYRGDALIATIVTNGSASYTVYDALSSPPSYYAVIGDAIYTVSYIPYSSS